MKNVHFFKKASVILLAVALLFLLCACSKNAENPGTPTASAPVSGEPSAQASDTPASPSTSAVSPDASGALPDTSPDTPSALDAYNAVLLDKTEFFSTNLNESMSIDRFLASSADSPAQITTFAVVDMDNDGTPEVVLSTTDSGNYQFFEILHYDAGTVYGYFIISGTLLNLKADGTYSYDSGYPAVNWGFGAMSFSEDGSGAWRAYSQPIYHERDDQSYYYTYDYYIKDQPVTEDEFNAAVAQQNSKPDAAWYAFTSANIEAIFSGPTPPSIQSAYQSVMQDGAEFYSTNNINTDENQNITLNRLLQNSGFGGAMKVTRFAVIDLDRDGTPEVVLNCAADGTDYFTIVLHEQDGTVYGYKFFRADFSNLKADGTYSFSRYEPNYGFGVLECSGSSCMTDKITYRETHDSDGYTVIDPAAASTVVYVVNHQSAAEDEFNAAIAEQQSKPDVAWYDFTTANIEAVLSGS